MLLVSVAERLQALRVEQSTRKGRERGAGEVGHEIDPDGRP
jgi:hypothetical protein